MKINIIYEVNNREYINCVLLERILVSRGHDVKIYNKQENIAVFRSADITIIPNSYRSSDVEYYKYVFNTKNNLVIVYPCEQVTNYTLPVFFDYSSNNLVKNLPHLCWGEDYYKFIESLGFNMKYSEITGAIQLDLSRKQFASMYHTKNDLSEQFNIPREKKWILFISDFVFISEQKVKTSIACGESDPQEIWERHEFEKKTRDELLKWFQKFLDSHKDYIIIYRKHPVEMLTSEMDLFIKNNKDNFYAISDYSIKEWIFNVDYICSWDSTSVVECFAAGKKMAQLRPYDLVKDGEVQEYSFYRDFDKIRNYSQFSEAMENGIPEYTENSINEIKKLYSIEDKLTAVRIAESIEKIYMDWKPDNDYNKREFFIKRWKFIFKRKLVLKVLLKNIYKFCYIHFRLNLSSQNETKLSVIEWNATAENIKKHDKLSVKIDDILKMSNKDNY